MRCVDARRLGHAVFRRRGLTLTLGVAHLLRPAAGPATRPLRRTTASPAGAPGVQRVIGLGGPALVLGRDQNGAAQLLGNTIALAFGTS